GRACGRTEAVANLYASAGTPATRRLESTVRSLAMLNRPSSRLPVGRGLRPRLVRVLREASLCPEKGRGLERPWRQGDGRAKEGRFRIRTKRGQRPRPTGN